MAWKKGDDFPRLKTGETLMEFFLLAVALVLEAVVQLL
jgi:hypothetical protein